MEQADRLAFLHDDQRIKLAAVHHFQCLRDKRVRCDGFRLFRHDLFRSHAEKRSRHVPAQITVRHKTTQATIGIDNNRATESL